MKASPLLLILFSIICNAQVKKSEFTFRNGVSLSHWTGNMIEEYTYADPTWFGKNDVEWIAASGIDHIQLYVAGSEIITPEGGIIADKAAVIDSLISWCKALNLGVIISPGRMPTTIADSTLSKEAQLELRLKKQVMYIGAFSNHFKNHGSNIRFMINIGGDDNTLRNRYFKLAISEIRKTNPDRKLYLMAYTINRLADLYIPEHDKNIIVAAEMAQSTEAKAEAIDVFIWQHQDYYFSEKMPPVTFPGTIPALDTTVTTDLSQWAIKFSGAELKEEYFHNKFKMVNQWMKQNHPDLEFYIPYWRYWTGYPFDPKTVQDEKSVKNFIQSFVKAARKNNITWCFYDYNSGSGIRYPNGEKAFILKAMALQKE